MNFTRTISSGEPLLQNPSSWYTLIMPNYLPGREARIFSTISKNWCTNGRAFDDSIKIQQWIKKVKFLRWNFKRERNTYKTEWWRGYLSNIGICRNGGLKRKSIIFDIHWLPDFIIWKGIFATLKTDKSESHCMVDHVSKCRYDILWINSMKVLQIAELSFLVS